MSFCYRYCVCNCLVAAAGETPLIIAACNGFKELVHLFLQLNADVNVKTTAARYLKSYGTNNNKNKNEQNEPHDVTLTFVFVCFSGIFLHFQRNCTVLGCEKRSLRYCENVTTSVSVVTPCVCHYFFFCCDRCLIFYFKWFCGKKCVTIMNAKNHDISCNNKISMM